MSDVAKQVYKIVAQIMDIDLASMTPNTRLDTGSDFAMQRVELFMALEEEFGCEFPNDAAEHVLTVKDAIEFISAASS